jgi:hypothetical protein
MAEYGYFLDRQTFTFTVFEAQWIAPPDQRS